MQITIPGLYYRALDRRQDRDLLFIITTLQRQDIIKENRLQRFVCNEMVSVRMFCLIGRVSGKGSNTLRCLCIVAVGL